MAAKASNVKPVNMTAPDGRVVPVAPSNVEKFANWGYEKLNQIGAAAKQGIADVSEAAGVAMGAFKAPVAFMSGAADTALVGAPGLVLGALGAIENNTTGTSVAQSMAQYLNSAQQEFPSLTTAGNIAGVLAPVMGSLVAAPAAAAKVSTPLAKTAGEKLYQALPSLVKTGYELLPGGVQTVAGAVGKVTGAGIKGAGYGATVTAASKLGQVLKDNVAEGGQLSDLDVQALVPDLMSIGAIGGLVGGSTGAAGGVLSLATTAMTRRFAQKVQAIDDLTAWAASKQVGSRGAGSAMTAELKAAQTTPLLSSAASYAGNKVASLATALGSPKTAAQLEQAAQTAGDRLLAGIETSGLPGVTSLGIGVQSRILKDHYVGLFLKARNTTHGIAEIGKVGTRLMAGTTIGDQQESVVDTIGQGKFNEAIAESGKSLLEQFKKPADVKSLTQTDVSGIMPALEFAKQQPTQFLERTSLQLAESGIDGAANAQFSELALKAHQFLYDKYPFNETTQTSLPQSDAPTRKQLREFTDYTKAVQNPLEALKDPNPRVLETLNALYPALLYETQGEIRTYLSQNPDAPREYRRWSSQVLGMPVNKLAIPANNATMNAGVARAENPGRQQIPRNLRSRETELTINQRLGSK